MTNIAAFQQSRAAYTNNDPVNMVDPSGKEGIFEAFRNFFASQVSLPSQNQAYQNQFVDNQSAGDMPSNPGGSPLSQQAVGNLGVHVIAASATMAVEAPLSGVGGRVNLGELVASDAIRFSQNSVSSAFKSGGSLKQLVEELKAGVKSAADVPAIRVFNIKGNLTTLDNRRLKAFQDAGLPIRTVPATKEEVANEAFKMTSKNEGVTVKVRGEPEIKP